MTFLQKPLNFLSLWQPLIFVLFGIASAVQEQSTVLLTTSGFVTFDAKKTGFQQTFIITIDGENWKIVSDTFRFQTSFVV